MGIPPGSDGRTQTVLGPLAAVPETARTIVIASDDEHEKKYATGDLPAAGY
jgi:hypothetical protein